MKAKTAAERKRAERERYREAGLKLKTLPIHPADEARVLRFVERLNRRRGIVHA